MCAGIIKVESSDLTRVDISETLSRIAVVDPSSSIESHLILFPPTLAGFTSGAKYRWLVSFIRVIDFEEAEIH